MTALEVADWRRQVFAMYAHVRDATDLYAAHDLWRRERDRLFATHPSSPLLPEDLAEFTGLPVRPYDRDWRFEVEVLEVEHILRCNAAFFSCRCFNFLPQLC